MKKIFRTSFQIAKVGLAFGLLYYLVSSGRIDIDSLKALWEPTMVVSGILCGGTVLLVASERWRLLLRQQQFNVTALNTFRLTLIGNFFSIFVPGGVGGDVVKAVLIAHDHPQNRAKVVLTVLADRVLGLFTMIFLGLCAFSFEPQLLSDDNGLRFVFLALCILFAAFLLAFFFILSPRAAAYRINIHELLRRIPRVQKLWIAAQSYHLSPSEIFRLFTLSIASQLICIAFFVIVAARIMPEVPSLSVFLFAVPVGFMVNAIPLSPGGIGVGQAAFFYLFSKAMAQETDVGAIGITAFQAVQFFFGSIGAILFVLLKQKNPKLKLEEDTNISVT